MPQEISQWINQHTADAYFGIGVSPLENTAEALLQASALARQQLASTFETQITAITKDKRKIFEADGETERIASIENATKQEVRQKIQNSQTFGPCVNEKGDTYVLVYIMKETIQGLVRNNYLRMEKILDDYKNIPDPAAALPHLTEGRRIADMTDIYVDMAPGGVNKETIALISEMRRAFENCVKSVNPPSTEGKKLPEKVTPEKIPSEEVTPEKENVPPQAVNLPSDPRDFNSVGVYGGSSFAEPKGIVGVMGTFSPYNYLFLDGGLDLGLGSRYKKRNVVYYSLYPYLHINGYLPLVPWFGLFAGAGAGYMLSSYQDASEKIMTSAFVIDATAGVVVFDCVRLAYSARFAPRYAAFINKVVLGLYYRFK
jgi:hypothetical protein